MLTDGIVEDVELVQKEVRKHALEAWLDRDYSGKPGGKVVLIQRVSHPSAVLLPAKVSTWSPLRALALATPPGTVVPSLVSGSSRAMHSRTSLRSYLIRQAGLGHKSGCGAWKRSKTFTTHQLCRIRVQGTRSALSPCMTSAK